MIHIEKRVTRSIGRYIWVFENKELKKEEEEGKVKIMRKKRMFNIFFDNC